MDCFKKRFDGFVYLVITEQSINALDLTTVSGDQDYRWKAHQTSELFCGVIIADQDRIIHGLPLSPEPETLLLDKRNNSALALFVHRHAQNGKPLCSIFLLHGHQPPNFHSACSPPPRPE